MFGAIYEAIDAEVFLECASYENFYSSHVAYNMYYLLAMHQRAIMSILSLDNKRRGIE